MQVRMGRLSLNNLVPSGQGWEVSVVTKAILFHPKLPPEQLQGEFLAQYASKADPPHRLANRTLSRDSRYKI